MSKEKENLHIEKMAYEEVIKELKKKLDGLHGNITSRIRENLKKHFSQSQVNSMLEGKRVTHWQEEDICRAVALRSLSSKAYSFLRKQVSFPLPSVSTINRWVMKLDVECGVLLSVLHLLKQKALTMSEYDRVCVLSFDEMSVAQQWSYDRGTDTIHSPKSKVQCAMIRGLTKSWKQLVFYNFDTDMTRDVLCDLIVKLEATGMVVVAMVNDLGPSNVKLWNMLGIGINKPSFTNPAASDREVFVFADAPHLLKLIRNNFLDHGFSLNNNFINISSGSVRELVIRSVTDLKAAHRLSHKHIDVQGFQRMNVRLAAQLLSNSTAMALKYFGEQGFLVSHNWEDTSNFLSLANSWFDVFNSRTPREINALKAPYGMHLPEQSKIVEDMLNTAKTMKVGRKGSFFPFQKGLIISCQSLPKLYDFVKTKYNVQYIITHRLNQDGVEHFFGCLRQMGISNQHPSPVEVKYRIRSYLVGKNAELVGRNYNTERENHELSLTGPSFPEDTSQQHSTNDIKDLDSEIMVSAMLFSSMDVNVETENDIENDENNEEMFHVSQANLEECVGTEGLKYFGGYIAHKFPKYDFLGKKEVEESKSWINAVSRRKGALFTPKDDFLKKLQAMERLFVCYHGQKTLRPGKDSMKNLTKEICKYISLPYEIVNFFVKCRVFFRIRILNNNMKHSYKAKKKLKRL